MNTISKELEQVCFHTALTICRTGVSLRKCTAFGLDDEGTGFTAWPKDFNQQV